MTAEERIRVAEIRRRAKAAETLFLLDLIDKLDKEVGRAVASAAAHKELGDAYQVAAEREEAELRAKLTEAELHIARLEDRLRRRSVH